MGDLSTRPLPPEPVESEDPGASRKGPETRVPHARISAGVRLWAHRIGVLIFVFACASAGVVLVIFPWRAEWTDNYLLFRYPELRAIVASAFFRGVCTGLGMLDIWIGFWEALHYHEHNGPQS